MEAFNPNSYIPFLGIKQDKILCEKMMQQYRKEYPVNFHSPSKIESSFEKHQNNPKYQAINRKLVRVWRKYINSLADVRENIRTTFWGDYVNLTKNATMANKTANCSEQATLLQDIFLRNGESAHKVAMEIRDNEGFIKKTNGSHTFLVTGLKEGADYKNPKTWGNKAIVVDPWSNIIMNANDAIEHFKETLNFNPNSHKIRFYNADSLNVEKYLAKNKKG